MSRVKKLLVVATGLVAVYVILVFFSISGRPSSKPSELFELFQRTEATRNVLDAAKYLLVNVDKNDTETSDLKVVHFLKGLNQHTWEKNCQKSLEQLCNFPIFPKAPDIRSIADDVDITSSTKEVDGIRLLGFLKPNVTGEFLFSVKSNGFVEVWLSKSTSWREGTKIAQYPAKPEESSLGMKLSAYKTYYIDIVYARGGESNGAQIQLSWKRPDQNDFEVIDGQYFAPYKNDSDKARMKVYDDDLPDVLACASLRLKFANKHMKSETTSYLESAAVSKALDFCEYKPSYLLNPANLVGFGQYHGVYRHAHKTYSFPYSNVDGIARNPAPGPAFMAENPLEEQEARSVVDKYITALEKSYDGKYKFSSIKHVEMKADPQKGKRYLLELVVQDLTDGKSYLLAEYVFLPNGKDASLCYPSGLQWNKTADVFLILTAKNLGRWVHHFIKNVEKIVQETKDDHLHVVIYDFGSPDIDIEQAFQRSTLKNYHFIIKPGRYSRTTSFSEAIKSINNPDAIIVTIDLHLDIGSQAINDIRKHCSKGRTVYAPQIVFLHCGGSSNMPRGVWYHYSYGTIAMYKRDWETFGGFSQSFVNKVTWGGEDWDIIDGAVKGGLEIERKRAPWIYHYHHTKDGMWKKR